MKNSSKKYRSLFGILLLIVVIGYIGYRSFDAYLSKHEYYSSIFSSGSNRWIVMIALLCAGIFPLLYWLVSSKFNLKKMLMRLGIGAGVFGLIHCHIKGDPIGFGNIITIFNTLLLFGLGTYLILGFTAIGSWINRKLIKFQQNRWQEILLSFGVGMCGFIIVVQILLGIGLLYGIVSWLLFLGLGFMVRYERKQLSVWGDKIETTLEKAKNGLVYGTWNLKSKEFWSSKIGFIALFVLVLLSVSYLYIGIQNSFTPYSTAWDANHEYMYIPKILAENAGIYRGNTVANNMPGMWHQFLTFIFSLTGCTNGRFGLSPDNIAISMNNISSLLVLLFGIGIMFQIFTLIGTKKDDDNNSDLKKGKDEISETQLSNGSGIITGWVTLLLRLTSGMGAFLVIVDNKTDLGVMALSLLALLAGLIFLQNYKDSNDKKELWKYIVIAGVMFGFAALAKITAFVDFALFGLLLLGLRFSPIVCLGVGITIMGLVRKLNILTSAVMISDSIATWLIIIGLIITAIGLVLHLSKSSNRKKFGTSFIQLVILGISFFIPFLCLKLPWTAISQIKTDKFSITGAIKSTFLAKTDKKIDKILLAQNDDENILESQNNVDMAALSDKGSQTFSQCMAIGNIYSEEELTQNLQEVIGDGASEDFGRYIGYGWKSFSAEKNGFYRLLKLLRPTSDTCYGLNHDAKVLCNNSQVIDNFKIDDLRAIYENGIKDQNSEAGLLLKDAIDTYNEARSEGKIGFGTSNSQLFYDEVVALRQYYQSHSISSTAEGVSIPYRYLVPLNISFNWSLQNLSSYYTDIGFVWVIIYVILLVSLPYAIVKKNKILTSVSLTTLIGWGIWWIIGSAILWYGTALISWTMITLALFMDQLFRNDKNEEHPKILPRVLVLLLTVIFGTQIWCNFMRIASQGANSVFVWYKGNVGRQQIIDDSLQSDSKVKYGYGWKDIFDLQFPQYNPIINALAVRHNEDGVIVAGTYSQYFLGNQWNIKGDGMLSDFWVKTSDGDLCKTYWRLRNDKTRYLIVDPNIGTVTMGEGNESLFYRFFGKLNSDKSEIEIDGTITTLIRLAQSGYLQLLSTNNIGSKYAFVVDDETIRNYFGEDLTEEELILTRAKMAVMQYFDDADAIFGSVVNIFMTRIINNMQLGIEDIADIYGMEVNSYNVANAAYQYLNGQKSNPDIKKLNQNEKSVLITYINLYSTYIQNPDNIGSMVQNLLVGSVTGGSQIIALKLN